MHKVSNFLLMVVLRRRYKA